MNKNSHLALGGLFITLHLLFLFLSRILVGSELILVIFLPLLSTIYNLKFNKKESAIYLIATFLLCVIFEPISTLIYVLPSLICGTTYGILAKKDTKELSLVYISSLAHSISLFISFCFISLLFKEVEFFSIFESFLNKEGYNFYVSIYLILLCLGVLESFLVHIITSDELKKLSYKEIEGEQTTPVWIHIGLVISILFYAVLSFINPILTCYIFPILLSFVIPIMVEFVMQNKHKWIYFVSSLILFGELFIIQYVDVIFYPVMLILAFSPIVLVKNLTVLYTIFSNYSNNEKNRIK